MGGLFWFPFQPTGYLEKQTSPLPARERLCPGHEEEFEAVPESVILTVTKIAWTCPPLLFMVYC